MMGLELLDTNLIKLFKKALWQSIRSPGRLPFILRAINNQKKAAGKRRRNSAGALRVPPLLIMSVTGSCNLSCSGCYAGSQGRLHGKNMDPGLMRGIIKQASGLGVSVMLVSGGEPLMYEGLLDILKGFPEMIFLIFTNGYLLDDAVLALLHKHKHIIPVLSLEGGADETDSRRGAGAYGSVIKAEEGLKGLFYGISLTVSRDNFGFITGGGFAGQFSGRSRGLVFLVEYVPCDGKSSELVLTLPERARLREFAAAELEKSGAIIISFPGDEEKYGGCLSAGRGFAHINALGELEPCPFSPYSAAGLDKVPLKEALASEFLKTIRENKDRLNESKGGCALFENDEWVKDTHKNY